MPSDPGSPAPLSLAKIAAARSLRDGLVWGFDFADGAITPVVDTQLFDAGRTLATKAGTFRWLHVNTANQASRRWIEDSSGLPEPVRELMLSGEPHQRALVAEDFVACVLHDYEMDFGSEETTRIGSLSIALGPSAMVTARHHPLSAGEIVKRRVEAGARPQNAAQSFDLVVSSILEVASRRVSALGLAIQSNEDKLLSDGWEPEPQALVTLRREAVRLHRQLSGIRAVLQRLEIDEDLPDALLATVEKLNQRVTSLHADVLAAQADVRLLRDELDLHMTQRTNRNLYVLSILSALLLPATLVTGFFGMNTGGMPWNGAAHGTLFAGAIVAGSAASIYIWLRGKGFLSDR